MRTSVALILVAVLLVGCEDDKTSSESNGEQDPPAGKEQSAEIVKSGDSEQPEKATTDAAPSPEGTAGSSGPKFLATQLGHEAREHKFLGWTADGNQFVFESARREVVLRAVYDALTQNAVHSFQISGKLSKRASKELKAAWKEASPKPEWDAWAAANPLAKPEASLASPDGAWKVAVKLDLRRMHKWPIIKLKKNRGGYTSKWELWLTDPPDDAEIGEIAGASEGVVSKPRYTVRAEKGKEKWKVLLHNTPWDDNLSFWMTRDENLVSNAQFRVYWSPTGNRFLFTTHHRASENNEKGREDEEKAAFFVRTPGPQVVLRDGGAGIAAVRAKAAELGAAGTHVQAVGTMDGGIAETTVYYRGDAKATADKLAADLGASKVEELKKKGWVHVIAIMAR